MHSKALQTVTGNGEQRSLTSDHMITYNHWFAKTNRAGVERVETAAVSEGKRNPTVSWRKVFWGLKLRGLLRMLLLLPPPSSQDRHKI